MAKQDAELVVEYLKKAGEAAVPLKDKDLSKKINEASEHVTKRLDTKAS